MHYNNDSSVLTVDKSLDLVGNFTNFIKFNNKDFTDVLRLYITIHADHEGGNVSAHTSHLVGSALSDAYLSVSAAINGLAGPLHGLANQEVLIFLQGINKKLNRPSDEQLAAEIDNIIASGRVVPGFGHAVLRECDPR